MIKPYWETTADAEYPLHVYFLDDERDKMYAYVIQGDAEITTVFKNPIRFNARRRTFVEVPNIWAAEFTEVKLQGLTVGPRVEEEFIGSRGDTYYVKNNNGSLECTCPGFTYRGDCKHVKIVAKKKLEAE
jgi:hypothetical protein